MDHRAHARPLFESTPDGFPPAEVTVRLAEPHERVRRDATVARHHHLGFKRFAGRGPHHVVERRGERVALAGWQPSRACTGTAGSAGRRTDGTGACT